MSTSTNTATARTWHITFHGDSRLQVKAYGYEINDQGDATFFSYDEDHTRFTAATLARGGWLYITDATSGS